MKRSSIITLLLALMVVTPTLLHAQIIKGEVFFGGNACQVDGDECYGFKKFDKGRIILHAFKKSPPI